ncbi:hypothetical protein QKU48_gp1201 [Fadolivirus algeromassiliense]|uniref:Uncharacterized protein n=1 Tax=Fadolivirus FV1/VV64 TaxID=3070911 RepID=A0A7D3QWK8_9VIRU|nr:hypothetical protein QKU48_gp1201 [Fadolivirus algeromassiliense]QKF94659.1 hypothetical protein Fadolivirus_1_1201 [Fadolivirus FV1/VV64]
MTFGEELEYNNSIIKLQDKQIESIFFMIGIQQLPNNVTWDTFFIYKYIESVKIIDNNNNVLYSVNGLYLKGESDIKMKINNPLKINNLDNIDNLKKLGEMARNFFIPIITKRSFTIDKTELKLDIQINKNITTPLLKNPPIKLEILVSYQDEKNEQDEHNERNKQNEMVDNDNYIPMCHRIEIPNEITEFRYDLKLTGISKGLFFYNDSDFKITNIQLTFDNISQSYSFQQLSLLLPYLHLDKMPDNDKYLYLPFMTNPYSEGLDLQKVGVITIIFNLYNNCKGGNIYIFSKIKDADSNQIKMDKWIYEKDITHYYTEELNCIEDNIIINISI